MISTSSWNIFLHEFSDSITTNDSNCSIKNILILKLSLADPTSAPVPKPKSGADSRNPTPIFFYSLCLGLADQDCLEENSTINQNRNSGS